MITLPEDAVGRGEQLLYPRVSTCLPFTLDLCGELIGAHLPVGSPAYLLDEIMEQMRVFTKGRPIRSSYAIGMLSEWEQRPVKNGQSNYTWPAFADTVRDKLGRMFPVYAFNAAKVDSEVVITASAAGYNSVRIEVASSKLFTLATSNTVEDGEAIKLTSAKVKSHGNIVQGVKRMAVPNRDRLVKQTTFGNLFRKTHTIYMQNCQEF